MEYSFSSFIFIYFPIHSLDKRRHMEMRVRTAHCNLQVYKCGEKQHMLAACVLLPVKSNCEGIIFFQSSISTYCHHGNWVKL